MAGMARDGLPRSVVWSYASDMGALSLAAHENDVGVAAEVLRRRKELANVTLPGGYTPLHTAAENGNVHVAAMLLHAGAEVDAVDQTRRVTALFNSVVYGRCKVLPLLLGAGADPDAGTDGRTATHLRSLILAHGYGGGTAALEALLKAGVSCPMPYFCPLHMALDFASASHQYLLHAKALYCWGFHIPAEFRATPSAAAPLSRAGGAPPVQRNPHHMMPRTRGEAEAEWRRALAVAIPGSASLSPAAFELGLVYTKQRLEDAKAAWRGPVTQAYANMHAFSLEACQVGALDYELALLHAACYGVEVGAAADSMADLDRALAPTQSLRPRPWVCSDPAAFSPANLGPG